MWTMNTERPEMLLQGLEMAQEASRYETALVNGDVAGRIPFGRLLPRLPAILAAIPSVNLSPWFW